MKKTVCALAAMAVLTTMPAMAGNLNDAMVSPTVIAEDTASSSSSAMGIVVLLGLLVSIPAFVD